MSENDFKLLPCPFCSGEGEIYPKGKNGVVIRCKRCFITKEQRVIRNTVPWLMEEMAKEWNQRAEIPEDSIAETYQRAYLKECSDHQELIRAVNMLRMDVIESFNKIRTKKA